MTPESDNGHGEILARLREIETQVQDTNKRVKSMERRANIGLIFKLIWIAFLLAIPFFIFQMVSGVIGGPEPETSQFGTTVNQLNQLIDLYKGQ